MKIARERFEEKFIPEPNSGCWIWTAATGGNARYRYGEFSFNGCPELAHRVSWILYRGDIPDGLNILHRCDNGLCVNPHHLFSGTQQDNMHDMIKKGRDRFYPGDVRGRFNRNKTCCKRGHPLSGDNLRIRSSGSRECVACMKLRGRELYQRRIIEQMVI
jgi:hypothetical protein